MLSIHFLNDGTGKNGIGNYEVVAMVNREVIWRGEIKNFEKARGWRSLIDRLVSELFAEAPDIAGEE